MWMFKAAWFYSCAPCRQGLVWFTPGEGDGGPEGERRQDTWTPDQRATR